MAAQSGSKEYRLKLAKADSKKYHVMRFKPPHKCDLEKLVNPTLDRQLVKKEEEEVPTEGEGSEYNRKRREEARMRRRGYRAREARPEDQPWVLREGKRGGKHFIGRKEGTVNASSSYYVLTVGKDDTFDVVPVEDWYDFVPPVKYNYIKAEEAEERFEQRNKTLNYFSIMVSKKLREGEADEGEGPPAEGGGASKRKSKAVKKATVDSGLLLTDSESGGFSSSDEDSEGPSGTGRAGGVSRQRRGGNGSEAGEDTDEGEMESREVDYMSDSDSDAEVEIKAREAARDAPKDDQEVERKEEADIDKGFVESSSSSEDDLTEEGKEIQALMKRQLGLEASSSEGEEEPETMETTSEPPPAKIKGDGRLTTPTTGTEANVSKSPKKSKSSPTKSKEKKHSKKREREKESQPKPTEGGIEPTPTTTTTTSPSPTQAQPPPVKKQKVESTSTITESEVRHYLSRRPLSSKVLVKKFTSKKTDMDKNNIVRVLSEIIQGMKNVEQQTIKGKLYLSLKATDQ